MPPAARFASHLPSAESAILLPAAILVATVVGAALRLTDLGAKSFWLDEAFSAALVRTPWSIFAYQLRTREANSALFYLLLRAWMRLGHDEATIRLLPALLGIGTIPVVGVLGRRLFGLSGGIVAAFLIALDPFHLLLSQEARGYTLAAFLVTCSTWAFTHIVGPWSEVAPDGRSGAAWTVDPRSAGQWGWAIGYVAATTGAAYSHFYSAFVVIAQCASLFAHPRPGMALRRLMMCWPAIGAGVAPLGWFLLTGTHTNIDWLASAMPAAVHYLLHTPLTHVGLVAGLAYAAILLAVVTLAARTVRSVDHSPDRWAYWLVGFWIVTPIAIPLVITLTLKPVLEPRYLAVGIPALSLLAAALVIRAPRLWVAAGAVALILAIESFGDWTYYTHVNREDWRAATATIRGSAQPSDAAIFYAPYVRRAYDYYDGRWDQTTPAPRIYYPSQAYSSFGFDDTAPMTLDEAIARARRDARRTWLVLSHATPDSACRRNLDAALRTAYRTQRDTVFPAIEVRLYSDRVPESATPPVRVGPDAMSSAIAATCVQR